jgi:hypothetical protein
MKRSLPPRLRGAALLAVGAVVALVIGGAANGWSTTVYVLPVPILAIVGIYIWSGRDSDAGAVIRLQVDERLEHQRLRVQALVGRVLSLAVPIGYLVASATKTTLWPWAVMLGLLVLSLVAGWLIYGERRLLDRG